MSGGEVRFDRHPLCVCGPITFDGPPAGVITVEGCRLHAKAIYGIDPHPVLSAADLAEIMTAFREQHVRLGV